MLDRTCRGFILCGEDRRRQPPRLSRVEEGLSAVPGTCVIGLQWGDEAKGKLVDILTEDHDSAEGR